MAGQTGQTRASNARSCGICSPSCRDSYKRHFAALNKVIPLLRTIGVNAQLISHVPGETACHIPDDADTPRLIVYVDGGWRVATVSVAPRSGVYRVELPRTDQDNQELPDRVEMVPENRPARVAVLISAHQGLA